MDYELAKELRDAGFPQIHDYGKIVWDVTRNFSFTINSSDDYDSTGRLPFKNNQSSGLADNFVCFPTLSELIEACGERQFILKTRGVKSKKKWVAQRWYGIEKPQDEGYGKTPEEAVAQLWLELNKK